MAFVLTQRQVQFGSFEALKEPDVIPAVKYLFNREQEPSQVNHPGTTSDISLKLEIDQDVIVTCEDTSCLLMPVDAAPNGVELKIDQDETIDIVTFEDSSCFPVDAAPKGVELDIDQEEIIDIVACEDVSNIPTDAALKDVVTPPYSCKDFEESLDLADSVAKSRHKPKLKKLTIPLNKLRVVTNYKSKKPELEEDEYIFCSSCDKLQIGVCSIHGNLQWVKEPSEVTVAEGLTKARATIPVNMDLKSSSIPDAGLGIFATERFESDVVFGPYWGQKIAVADVSSNIDQSYMWDIIENGRVTHVVDARDENDSNWLRFVNCARNEDEQNLVAFQYRGEIYYRSYKVIEPGMELLVWYGDKYACDLDILDKDKKPADGPIQCQKCFMICSGPNNLASHNKFRCQMNNEHDRWRCMHCDRSFKTQSSLHYHKNIHKGLKPFTCRICGKAFSHQRSRNRHYSLHTGRESVSCGICGNSLIDENSLKTHMRKVHNWRGSFALHSTGKQYECKLCKKCFASQRNLNRHKKLHEKPDSVQCRTCGKLFPNELSLLKHEGLDHKTTSGGRKCQHCGRCFKTGVALSNHMRMHEKQTAFVLNSCSICKFSFTYSYNLARHMREKHRGVKVFKCAKCSKVCADKRRLALHVAIRHPAKRSCLKQQHAPKQEKANKGLQYLQKETPKVDSIECKHCNVTLPGNKLLDHKCIHAKKTKVTNTSTQTRNSFVGNQGCVTCEFCFRVFRTSKLMYCHRASHFRKANTASATANSITKQSTVPTEEDAEGTEYNIEDDHFRKFYPNVHDYQQSNPGRDSSNPGRSPTGRYCCHVCNKSFRTERSLRSHKTHHGRSRETGGASPNSLLESSQQSAKSEAISPSCESGFSSGQRKLFICGTCGKKFHSKLTLGSHKGHHRRANSLKYLLTSHQVKANFRSKTALGGNVPKPYECSKCLCSFQYRRHLVSHQLRFHVGANAKFACPFCDRTFSTKESLLAHKQLLHNTANPFTCLKCNGQFSRRYSLNHHVCRRKDGVGEHVCKQCLRSFQSKRALSNHKRSHVGANSPFICSICHQGLSSKKSLLRHRESQHGIATSTKALCNVQGSSKGSQSGHGNHAEDRNGSPVESKQSFESNANDIVSGGKHLCNMCLESYESKQALISHKRSHAGANLPFICSICHKGLSSKKSLLRHRKSQHSTATSPHPLYNGQLASKGSHSDHMTRTEEKKGSPGEEIKLYPKVDCGAEERHVCNMCFESFQSKQALHDHKRSHAGRGAPFICSICQLGLSSKSNLLRHKEKQHNTTTSSHLPYDGQVASDGIQSDLGSQAVHKKEFPVKSEEGFDSNPKDSGTVKEHHVCNRCLESFQSKQALIRHKRAHVGRGAPFICSSCDIGLSSRDSLLRHRKRKHNTTTHLPYSGNQNLNMLTQKKSSLKCNPPNNPQCPCLSCNKRFLTYDNHNKLKCTTDAEGKANSAASGQTDIQVTDQNGIQGGAKNSRSIWKCRCCDKDFQTTSGIRKHFRKKHGYKVSLDSRQVHRSDMKRTNSAWKCRPCGKEFQTEFGLIRHVEKRHNKRIWLDRQQGCKSDAKSNSSPWKYLYCLKEFKNIHGIRKHALRKHPERRKAYVQLGCNPAHVQQGCKPEEKPQLRIGVNSHAAEVRRCTVRTFRCQYCHKGFSTIKGRYKHILLAHRLDLVSMPPPRSSGSESCSGVSHKDVIDPKTLAQKRRKAGHDKKPTDTFSISEEKSITVKQLVKAKTKRSTVSCKFSCRYCRRSYFSRSSRGKHELNVHGKRVSPLSVLSKQKERKIDKGDPFDKTFSSEEKVSGSENCEDKKLARPSSDRLDAKDDFGLNLQPRGKFFSCKHCHRQFFSVSARYKHILLVHSEDVSSTSVIRHLGTKARNGKWASKCDEKLSSHEDNSRASSFPPVKMTRPISSAQPSAEETKLQELTPVRNTSFHHTTVSSSSGYTFVQAKAFPCEFCRKSFSTCSLRYKHFLLVHSGSSALAEEHLAASENDFVKKPQSSFHWSTMKGHVPKVHTLNETPVSQNTILENLVSFRGSYSEEASNFKEDRKASKCRTCSMFFRSGGDWYSLFEEKHHSVKALSRIRSPSRPALRTISTPFLVNSVKTRKEFSEHPATKAQVQHNRFQCEICRLALSSR